MLLIPLALALIAPPAQRPNPIGGSLPKLVVKRVAFLPTTASYTSSDPLLAPGDACVGADLGLNGIKAPYATIDMAATKAAVKSAGLKTARGESPESSEQNWSSESGLKVATGLKADYYGMIKLTQAFRQDDATGKYVEGRSSMWLYDMKGRPVAKNVPLRARDRKRGRDGTFGSARGAAYEIGSSAVPLWYKSHPLGGK